jgi:phosphonate metabolism-associated iron-containing alcohol dehydrogenase
MSLDNFSYHMPTKIIYGRNSLKDIDIYINHRKALLVTSQGFVKRGLVDEIVTYTNNIVGVISSIKSHPEFVDIEEIYRQAYQNQFELIIAIGGGSVMDVAKFISVHNILKDYQFVEDLTKGIIPKKNYTIIPVISIPTTAGTGSEVSPYSTIWNMQERRKYSLSMPDLFCERAIYDPVLTLSVPKKITIQTGLDALSHALESIWNKNASPITIHFAIKSAKLIIDNLVKLSNDLENLECRDNLMKACMYAGFAFSNTQTAAAHAMSYYITAHKGIDHGIACSFTLPTLIDNVIGEYKFIDKALIEIFGDLSSNKLRSILADLGVKTSFSDYGIGDMELEKIKHKIEKNIRSKNSLVTF